MVCGVLGNCRSCWSIDHVGQELGSGKKHVCLRLICPPVSPVLPFVRSACACLTHRPTADGTKSSSRATAVTDCPSSNTNRTVWALNSSLKRRRARLPRVVSAIVDIVSAFQKVSTKPDQAHNLANMSRL